MGKHFLTPDESRTVRAVCAWQWPHIVDTARGIVRMDWHQVAIVAAMVFRQDFRVVAVRGATSAGKGTAVAMGVALGLWRWPSLKVVVTSSRYDHAAREVMWPEIRRWLTTMRQPPEGAVVQKYGMETSRGGYVIVANPALEEAFAGHHGERVWFVFDEATGVPEGRWRTAATQADLRIALANPRLGWGWFRELWREEGDPNDRMYVGRGKLLLRVDADSLLNVRTGRKIIPGQLTRERAEEIRAEGEWWERVMLRAEWPEEDIERSMFRPGALAAARQVPLEDEAVRAFGLDIARSKLEDETVLAAGNEHGLVGMHIWREDDLMAITGLVLRAAREAYGIELEAGEVPVCVDADGLGAGVADRLSEKGVWVIEHRGSAQPNDQRAYANARAESYGILKGLVESGRWSLQRADSETIRELAAQELAVGSDWPRIRLAKKEGKGGIREKLGRSPDRADAIAYLARALSHVTISETPIASVLNRQ